MARHPTFTMAPPIAALSIVLTCVQGVASASADRAAPRVQAASGAGRHLVASSVYAQWLRVDPQHPRTVYVGGAFRCATGDYTTSLDDQCTAWVMRSTDGGATWSDLSTALGLTQTFADDAGYGGTLLWDHVAIDPLVLAVDGRHLYAEVDANS